MSKIYIPEYKVEEIASNIQCQEISERQQVKCTIFYQNVEYIITGSCSSIAKGYEWFWAVAVCDLALYKGKLKPLPFGDHYREIDAGNRERAYTGMILPFGNRQLVCLHKVTFYPSKACVQQELFPLSNFMTS